MANVSVDSSSHSLMLIITGKLK